MLKIVFKFLSPSTDLERRYVASVGHQIVNEPSTAELLIGQLNWLCMSCNTIMSERPNSNHQALETAYFISSKMTWEVRFNKSTPNSSSKSET
jgi:hypothetical protein